MARVGAARMVRPPAAFQAGVRAMEPQRRARGLSSCHSAIVGAALHSDRQWLRGDSGERLANDIGLGLHGRLSRHASRGALPSRLEGGGGCAVGEASLPECSRRLRRSAGFPSSAGIVALSGAQWLWSLLIARCLTTWFSSALAAHVFRHVPERDKRRLGTPRHMALSSALAKGSRCQAAWRRAITRRLAIGAPLASFIMRALAGDASAVCVLKSPSHRHRVASDVGAALGYRLCAATCCRALQLL